MAFHSSGLAGETSKYFCPKASEQHLALIPGTRQFAGIFYFSVLLLFFFSSYFKG